MGIINKLKNKHTQIQTAWETDIHFTKRYAKLRRRDTFFNAIKLKKLSDKAFAEREEFLVNFLRDCISAVIEKYRDKREKGLLKKDAYIWICWWTGLETVPPIVKQCIKSIYKRAGKHQVCFIDKNNYTEYLDVPDYIIKKMERGNIGLAHFADYLRVSLLERYGGLWLDGTIFCSQEIPNEYFEYPFFTLKSPYTESRYVSKHQWATFCLCGWQGNQFYSFLRESMEVYWLQNDYAIDYLLFDYLIFLAKENCPYIKELMNNVPENTPHRDDLQAAMNAALPAEQFWQVIREDTELYKLSWRETYSEKTADGQQSVYGYFLNMEL